MHRTLDPRLDPNGQAGMVGKALVVWLLIMAVLAVGIIDAVSIARTRARSTAIVTTAPPMFTSAGVRLSWVA